MTTCKLCNNQIPDDQKFCSKCGAKIKTEENEPDALFSLSEEEDVLSLGKPDFLEEEKAQIAIPEEKAEEDQVSPDQKKKSFIKRLSKKSKIIISAAMALIIAAGSVLPFVLTKKETDGRPRLTFYTKDNALYVASLIDGKSKKITDLNSENDFGLLYSLTNWMKLNKDGTRIFHTRKTANSQNTTASDLFYTDISFKDETELKSVSIDTDIQKYEASTDGEKIAYIKVSEQQLFYGSVDSRVQIDSEVTNFNIDAEFSTIYYTKSNGDFCIYTSQSGPKLIDNKITDYFVSEDTSIVYYLKDGYLFRYNNGNKISVDSAVDRVLYWSYQGDLYYVKKIPEALKYSDFIEDDKKDADAALKAPPTNPDKVDYETKEQYDAALKEYQIANAEYSKKELRDEIRQYCESSSYSYFNNTLFCTKGDSAVKISDNLSLDNYAGWGYSSGLSGSGYSSGLSFTRLKQPQITKKKINISSISNYTELIQFVDTFVKGTATPCYAYKTSVVELPQNTYLSDFTFNPSKTAVYFLSLPKDAAMSISTSSSISNNMNISGDLYKIELNGDTLGSVQKIDSDVSATNYLSSSVRFTQKSEKLAYFKRTNENTYDLLIENEKIDNVKSPRYLLTIPASDDLVYCNQTSLFEDIHIYSENKKTNTIIASDAKMILVYDKNCIIYYQYNNEDNNDTTNMTKDLYVYNGKKEPLLIDTDVDETIYYL